jgi:hypothetical protein
VTDDLPPLVHGLEPSGVRVAVLLVFYLCPEHFGDEPTWHVIQYEPQHVIAARRFARKHGTQVVASFVDVPKFALQGRAPGGADEQRE